MEVWRVLTLVISLPLDLFLTMEILCVGVYAMGGRLSWGLGSFLALMLTLGLILGQGLGHIVAILMLVFLILPVYRWGLRTISTTITVPKKLHNHPALLNQVNMIVTILISLMPKSVSWPDCESMASVMSDTFQEAYEKGILKFLEVVACELVSMILLVIHYRLSPWLPKRYKVPS